MKVFLSPRALKEFKALNKAMQNCFLTAFERLESDPYNLSKELRVKKLTDGRFSLRADKYRCICGIDERKIMVTVIRHRKDAYR